MPTTNQNSVKQRISHDSASAMGGVKDLPEANLSSETPSWRDQTNSSYFFLLLTECIACLQQLKEPHLSKIFPECFYRALVVPGLQPTQYVTFALCASSAWDTRSASLVSFKMASVNHRSWYAWSSIEKKTCSSVTHAYVPDETILKC